MTYKPTCDCCGIASDNLITLGDVIDLCPACKPNTPTPDCTTCDALDGHCSNGHCHITDGMPE